MSDPAIAKVEDALAAVLAAHPALAGRRIITDRSADVALDQYDGDAITVSTAAYSFEVSDENWTTLHTALVDFESVSRTQVVGTISRANHRTLAHIMAALAADRTLGGMVQDIQEIDVAPAGANGKDAGTASLQCSVQFFTPRDDWFTILGHSGAEF